jgi:outer membrane receptor protein involved in Fe transport
LKWLAYKRLCKILVTASIAGSSVVHAGGSAGDTTQLEQVTVNGQVFKDVDSATVGTVYSEQFQYRPLTRPGELMEVVPGLIVTQHSGEGKANQYFLRGFNLDHGTDFAIFLDGMPINLPTHAHGQGYSDLNFMIPELVDSIEYRKGPYYAQYGDFASAGAADIRYKDRLDAPFAEATGGLNGYARLVDGASYSLGGGDLLYGFEAMHYDGPFALHDNFNKGSAVLRWSRREEDGGYHIEALGYQAHWNSTDQIPQRAVPQITEFGCIDCSDAGSTWRYSLSVAFDRRLGQGTLSVSAYAVRYHLSLYSDFDYYLENPGAPPFDLGLQDPGGPTGQFEQYDTRNLYGGRLALRAPLRLGGLRFDNELGLQGRYDAIGSSGLYDTQDRIRFYAVVQDQVDESSVALYGQTSARFSGWLRVTLGARYDKYHAAVASKLAVNNGSATAGIASPKLSVVLGPFDKTEFFVNLGKGFHSNDARGVTEHEQPLSLSAPQGGAATPATFLPASRSADLGLRTALLPHTEIALSLFVLDLDSELTIDGDTGTTGIGGATRRSGAETSLFWRPLAHLTVDVDYAWTRARYRQAQEVGTEYTPPGTPYPAAPAPHYGRYVAEAATSVAAIGLSYGGQLGWTGALRLRYFGPRALNEDASATSHSTRLVNAGLGYRFSPRLYLSLEGTNLLNSRDHDIDYYYVSRLKGEPAGGYADDHFHPVEPIDGRVVLTYTY